MRTLYSIQYLRAFAALAVVVFHAGERTGMPFTIGAAGVDIFFVVSGFIMMAISDASPTSPVAFFRNRLLRIAPAYWAATLLMIVGAVAGLFPNLKLEFAHILGSFLFLPVASPSTGDLWPVLVQGWTLNYEIFFYAIFALVLFLKPGIRLAALAAIFGLLVAGGVLLEAENPILGFYTAPVILEFVAGAALAKLWQANRLPSPVIGAFLVVLSIAGFAAIQVFKLEFDAWSCGPLAFMLVMGALGVEASGKLPVSRMLTYLGDSSYSIYLWHTFAVSVIVKLGLMLSLAPPLTLAIAVVTGTLVGIAGYELLEKPVQHLLKGRRPFASRRTAEHPVR
ncbi:acyltransferase [Rhizobium sp. XQZ8]|uniref:acyltransferase family protein n=1 Tax=Rhizobium populisoli TaxID=2859785 RepID=UPI001C668C4C|nr:acyltransferase [Rhizobium populisoli]MBW6425262.1 acyltransferase [Rhizobium populisoli]